MRSLKYVLGAVAVQTVLAMAAAPAALAQLARVGPMNPANGYPSWYQDKTGLALDSCMMLSQAEADGGWCLLLTADIPNGRAPEVFPSNFADEHFYWSGTADAGIPGQMRAMLVLALEQAFGMGPVTAGDQVVFARVRVVINPVPFDGTYTVYTPYGKLEISDQVAGDRLFFTEDIGLAPGDFTQALNGRVGPFLLPSPTPGGAEVPPIPLLQPGMDPYHDMLSSTGAATPYPGNGRKYIADPGRMGPVTGSPMQPYVVSDGTTRNPNIFRVEGPNGFVLETTDFALSGRIFEGVIPGQIKVDRASYARSAVGSKVDVYATASPVMQARIPAGLPPATVPTHLSYFDAACTPTLDAVGNPGPPFGAPAAATANQMFTYGSSYFGQSQPATLSTEVCVQSNAVNSAGQMATMFLPAALADQVFITEALYDPANQALSVKASSSDQANPPTLTVGGFGSMDPGTGQLVVVGLIAPPDRVNVLSSARGSNDLQVSTGALAGAVATVPTAFNDGATTVEDTAVTIAVLANDNNAAGGIVTVTGQPLMGTAVVNLDGSVAYTPRLNAFGDDSFTYVFTNSLGQTSNVASVAIGIAPVNDAPVANPNNFTAFANMAATLNVALNDTDPDGAADIVAVANVSAVAPQLGTTGTGTATAIGKTVSFTATAAGIYAFTYQVQDAAGTLSNPTTVTVTVAGGETLAITRAEYVVSKSRIKTQGAISPAASQTITLQFVNSAGTVLGTAGTGIADSAGNWTVDRVVSLPTGTTRVRATSSNSAATTVTLAVKN